MSAITDELHNVLVELEAEGHAAAAKVRAIWAKLTGDATTLETEAKADETQVEHDAAPVVAEAKTDAEQLASEAVADVKDATQA